MIRTARLAVALVAVWLAACTTIAPLGPGNGGETLSGRLALRIDASGNEPARALSAAFELRGDATQGALSLSTPLGSMLAQARWSAGEVVLSTPQGSRSYPDLSALTADAFGESVPVEAWFDWLRGRPWPAVASTPVASTGAGTTDTGGFEQLGWAVDLARLDAGAVSAIRRVPLPAVTVRIQLDKP